MFTTHGTTEMEKRIGISPSSLGRYEKSQRQPTKDVSEQMRMAYWAAMQDRLHNLDLALRWIAGVGANDEHYEDEATLEHLPSLAYVRSPMPVPDYRDEDTMLFGYLGYVHIPEAA